MQCPFGGNHDLITWVSNHGMNRFWDMLGTDLPAIVSCIDVGPFKARNGSHIGQSIWRAGPHACLDSIELAAFLVQVRHFLKCLRSSLDPRFLGVAFFSKRTGLQLLLGYVVRSSNSTNVNSTVRTRIDLHYDDSNRKDMVENTSANMFPLPQHGHSRCVPKRLSSPQNSAVASTEPSSGFFQTILVLLMPSIGS